MAGKVVMQPNGLVDSWMLVAREMSGGVLRTGLTEAETERVGRRIALARGAEFVRVDNWRDLEE
jgi:hypothetical protein